MKSKIQTSGQSIFFLQDKHSNPDINLRIKILQDYNFTIQHKNFKSIIPFVLIYVVF